VIVTHSRKKRITAEVLRKSKERQIPADRFGSGGQNGARASKSVEGKDLEKKNRGAVLGVEL